MVEKQGSPDFAGRPFTRLRPTRRGLGLGLAAIGALGLSSRASKASERALAGYHPQLLPSRDLFERELQRLHDFGPVRFTGSVACRRFEEYLATAFAALGCQVERDQFRLTSWECDVARDCSLRVQDAEGRSSDFEVLSYYPFCGSTRGGPAVSGGLLYAGVGLAGVRDLIQRTDVSVLEEAIVVVDAPLDQVTYDAVKTYPDTEVADPLLTPNAPLPSSAIFHRGMMAALQDRCRGFIVCYTNVSDEAARYSWAPFSEPHGRIPALWVGAESGRSLRELSGRGRAEMRCDAKLVPEARADSLVATMPGQTDEVVLLTTHTDGPNECNENGAIGLLALATYAAQLPIGARRRTLVFCMPTGHYAMGAIADPVTGSGRKAGTQGFMASHPDIVDRCVAQVALEQMGAMEWDEIDGRYAPTGRAAPSFWLPTNDAPSIFSQEPVHGNPAMAEVMIRLFKVASADADPALVRGALVERGFAPGEGGALRAAGIPGLGLMGCPGYFFRADPKGVLDKLSPDVMRAQTEIVAKLLAVIDRLTPDQLAGTASLDDRTIWGSGFQ